MALTALPGDYGKPRPVVVIQSDIFNDTHPSIVLCPVTTTLVSASTYRVRVQPAPENGLRAISDIMVDKIVTLRRDKIRNTIGRLDPATIAALDRALMVFLGLV